MSLTRFVILHHRMPSGEQNIPPDHWDLMIEQGDSLATWRLERLPCPDDKTPITATRLGDHRKAYLTYEGPLTQNRGEVTRVEEGDCEILSQSDSCWQFSLKGKHLSGDYVLTNDGRSWSFQQA